MATNSQHARGFKSLRGNKWRYFDAQPHSIKEWLHDFPLNIWPGSVQPVTQYAIDETEKLYLADLRNVWGPDHPAVQDAAKRVALKGSKVLAVADVDDYF